MNTVDTSNPPQRPDAVQSGIYYSIWGQENANQVTNDLSELATLHNTKLSVLFGINTGTGDSAAMQMPTTVIKRPWIDPPDGSLSYDEHGKGTLPIVGGTVATIVQFVVPDGYDGVINAFSWNFTGGGFVNGSGDIIVQLLRNGAPIRNYDNILVEAGSIGTPRPISPIRIYSGQVITLTINHFANPLLVDDVVGSIQGYFYPSMS
jgi:hypothetical protein